MGDFRISMVVPLAFFGLLGRLETTVQAALGGAGRLGSGGGTCTPDLQLMRLASCYCSTPHHRKFGPENPKRSLARVVLGIALSAC
jgi:hypothetical protein